MPCVEWDVKPYSTQPWPFIIGLGGLGLAIAGLVNIPELLCKIRVNVALNVVVVCCDMNIVMSVFEISMQAMFYNA